jgi:acetyl-CoA acetyltransferase
MRRPSDAAAQACIVGIGQTEFAKWGTINDRSEFQLACEAVIAAAADANLPCSDIDGFASYANDANEPSIMQMALGSKQVRFASMAWGGGGGGACAAVAHAAAAVSSGVAHYVVAFRGLCQGQSFRFGQAHPWAPGSNFIFPFGLFAPPQMMALQVRRHMIEYGTTAEQLAAVAMACSANAGRNPKAVMRDRPLTLERYLASRMIAEPLRLYDCCLESDGACAVIVTTMERAADLGVVAVPILAAGQGSEAGWGTGALGGFNMPAEIYCSANSRTLARELYARAGVGAAEIDVAQLYDDFTGMVLMSLEDFGFCAAGEGGPFVAAGHIAWPDGTLPINTSGGNLAEAYIHGFNLVLEGVRQMRGGSTSQVAHAETCLVTGGPAVGPTSALILGRAC